MLSFSCLNAKQNLIIKNTANLVIEKSKGDTSGHDWWHIQRVTKNAAQIAQEENADIFVCVLAALLHDLPDDKLTPDPEKSLKEVIDFLTTQQVAYMLIK